MSRFIFYYGTNHEQLNHLRSAAASVWGDTRKAAWGSLTVLTPAGDCSSSQVRSDAAFGFVSGYVRRGQPQPGAGNCESRARAGLNAFADAVIGDHNWPLSADWTGNFVAAIYSAATGDLILCNDLIGYIPLYYSHKDDGVVGGTSLIAISRSIGGAVDPVGLLQRITTPYCNYGRRTLIKGIDRLLPGERVRFTRGYSAFRSFDSSLYKGLLETDPETVARAVWDCLKREILLACEEAPRVSVAVSGGWDSRLALAGLAERHGDISCYTYGSEDLYESRIAMRCAEAIGGSHRCFPIERHYFPSRPDFESLVRHAESANYMEWFSILAAVSQERRADAVRPLLLLGDLCESIDGRYIELFSSRSARRRSFVRNLLGKSDEVQEATPSAFDAWKSRKTSQIVQGLLGNLRNLPPERAGCATSKAFVEETMKDLELSFDRVADNGPQFAPTFDELFAWFHRVRFLLGNQLWHLGYAFHAVSPAMSIRFLRLITRVNPRLRIRRRLLNAIALLPDFRDLARIPSAQIPWVSAVSPATLRDLLWGVRSGLDQVLIRSVLISKNRWTRQRVLRSQDYIKLYRNERVIPTVQSWFSGDWVKPDAYVQLARDRANLTAWPLINVDICAPANVSLIADLCEGHQ